MSAEPLSIAGRITPDLVSGQIVFRRATTPVTPAMLAAGRAAFKRKRKLIDDLWQAFDVDIDSAVRHIYREMARAAE